MARWCVVLCLVTLVEDGFRVILLRDACWVMSRKVIEGVQSRMLIGGKNCIGLALVGEWITLPVLYLTGL